MSFKRRRPGPALAAALLGVVALAAAFYFKPYPALEDKQLLSAGIVQQLQHKQDADAYLELLIGDKLDDARHYDCEITTLSRLITDEKIPCIDLLKIDAEKAEVDVLRGIANDDWKKIHCIVIEAHSRAMADEASSLLRQQNFSVRCQLNASHARSEIFTLVARCP